jgi:hypothetical protein
VAQFIDSIGGLLAAQWVGLTFAVASVGKLSDSAAAVSAVERFQLLPASVARVFGLMLPWIELLLAVSLIIGAASRTAASFAIGLLVVFSIAQMIILLQGRRVECGCFGSASFEPVQWRDVARNIFLLLCCVWSVRVTSGYFELIRHVPTFLMAEVVAIQLMGTGVFLQFALIRSVLAVRRHEVEFQEEIELRTKALAIQTVPHGLLL